MASSAKTVAKTAAKSDADAASGSKSSLGLLYTGYLEKKNPVSGSFKKRFVVLTQSALHWFKRDESDDLFGEERGQLSLAHMLSNRILDEDSTIFEIQGTDGKKRLFRAATNVFCEEWLSAIRSAVKANARAKPSNAAARRASLSMQRHALLADHDDDEANEDGDKSSEVTVSLVSLFSKAQGHEVVVARDVQWGRLVSLPRVCPGDSVMLSTSTGGSVSLSYDALLQRAEEQAEEQGAEFDVALQNVPLASSLRLSVRLAALDLYNRHNNKENANNNGGSNNNNNNNKRRRLGRRIASSLRERVFEAAQVMAQDGRWAVQVVLSLMVLMAALSSCLYVTKEAYFLYLLAAVLSLHSLFQLVLQLDDSEAGQRERTSYGGSRSGVLSLALIVHAHSFTSPDAPVTEVDNDIPQRFIDGCDGDVKEARRRWDITRHWRESEGVNGVLQEPQPYFHLIRAMYPHYFCARGKSGHVVYYERPGDFEGAQIYARGVTLDDLVRHWLFVTEYQWQVLCKGDETAKSITVLDIANVKLSDVAGANLEYLKRTVGIANQHYPERSHAILIVNVPYFFSMMWRLVKPLVHENTQKKIRILNAKETLTGMLEYIDLENIPEYYGGKLDFGGHDSCRFHCPESLEINEYVRKINDKHAQGKDKDNADDAVETAAADLPPGLPGDLPTSSSSGSKKEDQQQQPALGTTATSRAMARRASLQHAPQRSSTISGTIAMNKDDDFSISSATTAGVTSLASRSSQ